MVMAGAAWIFDGFGYRSFAFLLAVSIGAYLVLAYLWANYTVAVMGITVVVLGLDMLAAGDGALIDVPGRLLATVIAGAWVLLISLIRPHRVGDGVIDSLASTLGALREYSECVRGGTDARTARSALLRERTKALATVTASSSEPRGIFDPPRTPIDSAAAATLLIDMVDTTTLVLAEELLAADVTVDSDQWERIQSRLAEAERRLQEIGQP